MHKPGFSEGEKHMSGPPPERTPPPPGTYQEAFENLYNAEVELKEAILAKLESDWETIGGVLRIIWRWLWSPLPQRSLLICAVMEGLGTILWIVIFLLVGVSIIGVVLFSVSLILCVIHSFCYLTDGYQIPPKAKKKAGGEMATLAELFDIEPAKTNRPECPPPQPIFKIWKG